MAGGTGSVVSQSGKWDIDPAGVNSVVSRTAQVASGLDGEVKAYGGHLSSAAKNAGTLSQGSQGSGQGGGGDGQYGLVALALSQFSQATEGQLKYLADRIGKSLHGAVDATEEYLKGDLQMAADTQKKAASDSGAPPVVLPPQGKK
jgi:hypothetical protein